MSGTTSEAMIFLIVLYTTKDGNDLDASVVRWLATKGGKSSSGGHDMNSCGSYPSSDSGTGGMEILGKIERQDGLTRRVGHHGNNYGIGGWKKCRTKLSTIARWDCFEHGPARTERTATDDPA